MLLLSLSLLAVAVEIVNFLQQLLFVNEVAGGILFVFVAASRQLNQSGLNLYISIFLPMEELMAMGLASYFS
jgi:hypothetical protein